MQSEFFSEKRMNPMMLVTVENAFNLGNRLVLVSGVDSSMADTLKEITSIEPIFPNASSRKVNIYGIELLSAKV